MTANPDNTALPVAGAAETGRLLWDASRGHRLKLAIVVVVGLLSSALGLIIPAALGWLVDRVVDGTANVGTVAAVTGAMIVSSIASAVGGAITVVLAATSYHEMLAGLRERVVASAFAVPQHVIERSGTGDLISRSSDDVSEIADAAPQLIPAITFAAFSILVTFAGMAVLDWRYAVALALVLPVYVLTMRWYLATCPQIYRAERAAMSARAQQLLESLRGFETVLGFGLGERRHRRVLDTSWQVVKHTLRARTVQNMFFGRLNVAEFLGMAAILVAGYLLIGAGQSTVGAVTTAMLFFLRLFGPINQLLFVIDVMQSALASLNRMAGVITMPADRRPVAQDAPTGRTAVSLRGVRFSYGDRPALTDIDLTIVPGERVAVVGRSGAGKTTLGGVVAGVRVPQSGSVAAPHDIAVITQETHVFAATLRENLNLVAPDATDDELRAALAAAGASALLESLPDGLDTLLGSTGHDLTSAQAQQVALARVLLADPELAIFDEATAEAGSSHADLLDRAAEAALTGRTALVIAHRLSQAAACDRVIVMADGRIVEEGTHAELIGTPGTYARLWQAWLATHSPGDDRL